MHRAKYYAKILCKTGLCNPEIPPNKLRIFPTACGKTIKNDSFLEDIKMRVVSIIIYGLFYEVLISIPGFIVFSSIRGATSVKEAASTQKEIK
jgi:hypothetical protein